MSYILPPVEKEALKLPHFPTRMQAFIFRNWDMVSKEKIAEVLKTSVENVVLEAERMGLLPQRDTAIWKNKGYITVIRANWHLLNYPQLCSLLGWEESHLAKILKEEDFLSVKVGFFKPVCDELIYRPLTESEMAATTAIRTVMEKYINSHPLQKAPFNFFEDEGTEDKKAEPARKGEIILDNEWYIKDKTKDATVSQMVSRFVLSLKRDYDVQLSEKAKFPIELALFSEEDEYHKIEITHRGIYISAGGAAGILRALYRIEALCKARGDAIFSPAVYSRRPRFKIRYIYPYCGLHHSALDVPSEIWCPDSLLESYARCGVNGLWLHTVLYQLSPFEFDPSISVGYENRRENLKKLIERTKLYGIKIYLYLNEPRKMPMSFFEKYPDMKGAEDIKEVGYACLCTQSERVREYIKSAVSSLCRACRGLGGIFTITMSENMTHCKAQPDVSAQCERCKDIPAWKLAADVNTMIFEAARSVEKDFQIIAWDWGWSSNYGFNEEDVESAIKAMPKEISVMCNRDREISFERGGIKNVVYDYALSVNGTSEIAAKNWKVAKTHGHTVTSKMQINNTWECSTVPYLPVFETVKELMEDAVSAGVDNLMLSWTLGGYPSESIQLISEYFFIENENEKTDFEAAMKNVFGTDWQKVNEAGKKFSEAFAHFPFDQNTVYFAPQNNGVSNLLYSEPTGYKATMTCFPYDDLDRWRSIYPADVFENQFRILCEKWEEGLHTLENIKGRISDISYVSYTLFKSTYNQIRFIRMRENFADNRCRIIEILKDEITMAEKVYEIMMRFPEIGFEAANHYYFNAAAIAEKIINCEYLMQHYTEK